MKTKTTQSQQIAYSAMLVTAGSLVLAIFFNNPFYAGVAFGFIMGIVIGATYIQTKLKETKTLLESAKTKETKETEMK